MINIPGYHLRETLFSSALSTVVRGTRASDGVPVVVKWLSVSSPNVKSLARYRYAWENARDLDLAGVAKVYDLVHVQDRPALIMEDIGGQSLRHLVASRGQLTVLESVAIARQVADALGRLHGAHLIHRDINPSNIVVTADLSRAMIIDFDISTRLLREQISATSAQLLEGTLAYISPEQTGRVNRATDHRTDLYSLGVTLYELVCGQRPFLGSDPLALVHSHIARPPVPPSKQNARVPEMVSRIICKLMEKTPEARYQSGFGLSHDLQRCLDALCQGEPVAPFTLGERDVSPWLQVSQRLYGREAAIKTLLQTFARAAAGSKELLLVSGFPGVGKTRLVREAVRDVSLRNGRFVSGKYNQLQNVPYAGVIQALRNLIRDILAGTTDEIAAWRERIGGALKLNAAVIVAVVPELALIIGEPNPPPMLDPSESLSRFQRVMVAFVRVLASKEHPLVLFLDDLQWAGGNSLALLQAMLSDPGQSHLMVIGAFRETQATDGLRIKQWRGEVAVSGAGTHQLSLEPLDREASDTLIADTLGASVADVTPLADQLWLRARGNPYFIEQMLLSLEADGGLKHDTTTGSWVWDLPQIRRLGLTDQVGDLLARKLARLPAESRHLVGVGACLGASCDLWTLTRASGLGVDDIWAALWPALAGELLVAVDDAWRKAGLGPAGGALTPEQAAGIRVRFAHDRVQEAAYADQTAPERAAVHLLVARLLAASEDAEQQVFDAANHFNLGAAFITSDAERVVAAGLNLRACTMALQSSAFGKALEFAQHGTEHLGDAAWTQQREMTLQLTQKRADAAQLNGRYDEAMALIDTAFTHATTPPERAELFNLRMQIFGRIGDSLSGIATGIEALSELFGFQAPTSPEGWMGVMGAEMQGLQAALGSRDPMALLDAPMLRDPAVFLQMRVLTSMVGPAYTRIEVLPFVVMRMVRLSVEHGTSPFSPLGYMTYSVLLCARGMVAPGTRFAELALALTDRMGARAMEAPLYQIYGAFVQHWTHPMGDVVRSLHRAITAGVETGAYLFAGWAAYNVPIVALVRGAPLAETITECAEISRILDETLRSPVGILLARCMRYELLELVGDDAGRAALKAEGFEGELQTFGDLVEYFKLINHVIFARWDEAATLAKAVAGGLARSTSHFVVPVFRYMQCIIAAESAVEGDAAARAAAAVVVRENVARFQQWHTLNPTGHAPYLLHVEAELAALEGDFATAEVSFDRAASAASEVGMGYAEAIACERAARWFEQAGKLRTARSFIVDAHYAWIKWGATVRAKQLESAYPRLRSSRTGPADATMTTSDTALDVQAVMRASQAISSEIILNDLLGTLMRTVVETAGAERGYLMLMHHDALRIEATVEAGQVSAEAMTHKPLEDGALCLPMVRFVERAMQPLVLSDALRSERFGHDPYVSAHGTRSVLSTPVINQGKLVGMLYLENNLAPDAFTVDRCQMLDILTAQAAISIENAMFYDRQEKVRQSMERFVPTAFVDLLGKGDLTEVALGDAVERDMGVLFSDVRSFTSISERMLPMEIFSYLNGYLERAGPVIRAHGGFIDKFIGDAVLALFPSDPGKALDAIVGLYRVLHTYNEQNAAQGRPIMRIGAALHWGKVALGTIGETQRLDATVISDTVNTASRLESMTKAWGCHAIVSGDVFGRVEDPDRFPHRFIGQVILRGREQHTPLYDFYATETDSVIQLRDETKSQFEAAVQLLHDRDMRGAGRVLEAVLAHDPDDRVARYLLSVARAPVGSI